MSLLIKDLDLPLICWGCPCFDDEVYYCNILDTRCNKYKTERLSNCPLVEISISKENSINEINIPKKPKLKNEVFKGKQITIGNFCPNCDSPVCIKENHCENCGQAIKWK